MAIFLIHGFGGTVIEVKPLEEKLIEIGIPVFMAKLEGHGEECRPIENISYRRWIASVRKERRMLEKSYRLIPVGFSMGGLIAAVLNSEAPFPAMIFINTPIYFWRIPQIVKNLLSDFPKASRSYLKSAGRIGPYAMVQFRLLLSRALPLFSKVDCPALVVQALDDDTVWPSSATYILNSLRQKPELYKPDIGGHKILLFPEECEAIAEKIKVFYLKNMLSKAE